MKELSEFRRALPGRKEAESSRRIAELESEYRSMREARIDEVEGSEDRWRSRIDDAAAAIVRLVLGGKA